MRDRPFDVFDEPLVRAFVVLLAALLVLFVYQAAFQSLDDAVVSDAEPDEPAVAPASEIDGTDGIVNASARAQVDEERVADLVLRYVNDARRERDREPLDRDPELVSVAQAHSDDMARHNYLSHTDRRGRGPTQRANALGYRCVSEDHVGVGENVARTYYHRATRTNAGSYAFYDDERDLARGVVLQWLRSEGHRRAMLAGFFDRVGTGVAVTRTGAVYVTQTFC